MSSIWILGRLGELHDPFRCLIKVVDGLDAHICCPCLLQTSPEEFFRLDLVRALEANLMGKDRKAKRAHSE